MIELRKKGESNKVHPIHDKNVHVRLNWKSAVDLDLHAYAITSNNELTHLYFLKKINMRIYNFKLRHRRGITAGDKQENLLLCNLSQVKKIIFVANIFRFLGNLFSAGDKFNNYDDQIYIKTLGHEIKFFLVQTN